MRLKTKLVLAITALVMCISGTLSLVYVSQLLASIPEPASLSLIGVASAALLTRARRRRA